MCIKTYVTTQRRTYHLIYRRSSNSKTLIPSKIICVGDLAAKESTGSRNNRAKTTIKGE